MYCCMNNKQLIKLSTPNYSKILTNFDAINMVWFKNYHPSKTEKASFTNIYMSVSFIVYIMSLICRGYYSTNLQHPPPPQHPVSLRSWRCFTQESVHTMRIGTVQMVCPVEKFSRVHSVSSKNWMCTLLTNTQNTSIIHVLRSPNGGTHFLKHFAVLPNNIIFHTYTNGKDKIYILEGITGALLHFWVLR